MSVHGQFAASQVESSTSTSHKNNTIIVFTSKNTIIVLVQKELMQYLEKVVVVAGFQLDMI
jgi:hypothetical protein